MANTSSSLQQRVLKLSRLHYIYVLGLAVLTIIYDSEQIISPDAVLQRWTMIGLTLLITTAVWYVVRITDKPSLHKSLVWALIMLDIIVASTLVYAERGMASRAVALYAVPIAVSAVLMSRSALLATASICTAFYSFSAVKYFVDYFNEGYKLELYSTIAFYSTMFFVLALVV